MPRSHPFLSVDLPKRLIPFIDVSAIRRSPELADSMNSKRYQTVRRTKCAGFHVLCP